MFPSPTPHRMLNPRASPSLSSPLFCSLPHQQKFSRAFPLAIPGVKWQESVVNLRHLPPLLRQRSLRRPQPLHLQQRQSHQLHRHRVPLRTGLCWFSSLPTFLSPWALIFRLFCLSDRAQSFLPGACNGNMCGGGSQLLSGLTPNSARHFS